MDIHVRKQGSDLAPGTAQEPLLTISEAARRALPGDTVIVHEGTYREWVDPQRGGRDELRRITYTAAPGEHVVIKGSEELNEWEEIEDGLWSTALDNSLFGDFNPYREVIAGDWLVRPVGADAPQHLGEVYLDGTALREVRDREELRRPPALPEIVDDWTGVQVAPAGGPVPGTWLAVVDDTTTTIMVNLAGRSPREALIEANVRRSVFFPRNHQIDYITVRGFELAHAATPWAPPTGDQPGLIGPNWARGWIIEDNHIHDAKCAAVSLGKEGSTGDNYSTTRGDRSGYQYQLESVFAGLELGWSREKVGSHVVRRNLIHDCGQNAVVGHMGCAFSTIEDNEIHTISARRAFYGHEIAGIKLHAAIDTSITHNHVHGCSLGIWLDWETQGTRVARNVLHDNSRDLFIEVSHGPYVVDSNVLASPASIEILSQGGAYVANLVLGTVRVETVPDRSTPYHLPHSTKVAGVSVVFGGDDRFIGNVFGPGTQAPAYVTPRPALSVYGHGTVAYDGCPSKWSDYLAQVRAEAGDHRRYNDVRQVVVIRDNVYLGGARGYSLEERPVRVPDGAARVETDGDGRVSVVIDLPEDGSLPGLAPVSAQDLGHVRMAGLPFTAPDGSPVCLSMDLVGNERPEDTWIPGPLAELGDGRICVWDADRVLGAEGRTTA
ncbi:MULTISPECIES: right-handed parallel beta-helix repeat-containing protein [Actinomyces]|uniref:Pectin lyase fold/virulence factor n=1 Tax=Actinomyces glycerinitolerans TaxID=1892869 RepID=A0A1M4RZ94_9ACTO|nr:MULTISPECIES: right-handed parallel beta-helix repeat-containing protein [Actinomyces]RAX18888.1 right-handed parallel beta-helix repeat-containing protein [Actinomyces sp. Z5]RAX24383.1 right-handed parallel beta-helix repeat-containing protein [Actinomyces sp. Z3]SHE25262.1 pectin lyase fold/virulence factor [Actinomyces glycerinitolerans]